MNTKPRARPDLPGPPPIAGLDVRHLVDDADYEPLSALIRDCHEHDGIPWMPTADNLRLDMRRDGIDPARDVVLAAASGQVVALTAVQRDVRDDVRTYVVWGWVEPGRRRLGLGRWLLDWSLRRAAERAAIEDPDAEVLLSADAEEREDGARALYERDGFVPVRQFFVMRRSELGDVPDLPLPESLEMRPVQPDQHRTIYDAENEAFRDHWGHREHGEEGFRQTFNQPDTNTDLWTVAWDGDQVAGVVETWIWPEENNRFRVRRGWLERISVRRPWRKRGVARALTAAAMVKLRAAGMDEAMLGVDSENPNGALGLYESLGFTIFRRSTAYRRPLER
ncbi:MAG: GNAT family N-acetyltransferase [Candidatus Limnocylindrales bacterium]